MQSKVLLMTLGIIFILLGISMLIMAWKHDITGCAIDCTQGIGFLANTFPTKMGDVVVATDSGATVPTAAQLNDAFKNNHKNLQKYMNWSGGITTGIGLMLLIWAFFVHSDMYVIGSSRSSRARAI